MKTLFLSLLAIVLLGCSVNAQTTNGGTTVITGPTVATNTSTHWPMEITIGGSGLTDPKTRDSQFGLAGTISVQPFSVPVWIGINQELGWNPQIVGATDLYSDYAWRLGTDKLYLNTGWSAGMLYDANTIGWRTGPEVSLEYYTKGNAFIQAGINYDLETYASGGWQFAGSGALRYSVGVGIAF